MNPIRGKGTLTRWIEDRGFGFITPDDPSLLAGDDTGMIMLHVTTLRDAGVVEGELIVDQTRFEFEASMQPKGYRARWVEVLGFSPYVDDEETR